MRRLLIALTLIVTPCIAETADSSGRELPTFLSSHYRDVFGLAAKGMKLVQQNKKDSLSTYVYARPDASASLAWESFACERDRCQVLYDNAVRYFDKVATENAGSFLQATQTEFALRWKIGSDENVLVAAKLPNSVLFATHVARSGHSLDVASFVAKFGSAINRQRYDEALRMDNVQMGLWSSQIHAFARELLGSGKSREALVVLKDLIAVAPFDYQAHLEIVENTPDFATVRDNAAAVYENAEDASLTARAGRYLGYREPDVGELPPLAKDEGGLRVVLIVLPPCDLRIARDAALLYEKIVGIPVRLSRLPAESDMTFGVPDRIPDQRRIQQAIIQKLGPNVDFSGWDLERYKIELLKTVGSAGALARFSMEDFVAKLPDREGQYDGRTYAERLANVVARYGPQDNRTIYVGLTSRDIFLGDTNYVFSNGGSTVSLLSYSRMTSRMTGERYESRKRVVERLAKQLVPPTLLTLGIPRPADPTDPLSYADGVERVDQKSLTLSGPTKAALDKLR